MHMQLEHDWGDLPEAHLTMPLPCALHRINMSHVRGYKVARVIMAGLRGKKEGMVMGGSLLAGYQYGFLVD